MAQLQAQLMENTKGMPKKFLQEVVDFSEFIKKKVQNQSFKKRMEQSEKDIEEGRVAAVTPEELFRETVKIHEKEVTLMDVGPHDAAY